MRKRPNCLRQNNEPFRYILNNKIQKIWLCIEFIWAQILRMHTWEHRFKLPWIYSLISSTYKWVFKEKEEEVPKFITNNLHLNNIAIDWLYIALCITNSRNMNIMYEAATEKQNTFKQLPLDRGAGAMTEVPSSGVCGPEKFCASYISENALIDFPFLIFPLFTNVFLMKAL